MTRRRKAAHGFQLIHLLGMIILTLMVSAIAVDFGFYYAAQNQLQTAADAASLAATTELQKSTLVDPADRQESAFDEAQNMTGDNLLGATVTADDVTFGFVNPVTKIYDPNTFTTPSDDEDYAHNGGYNAVYVKIPMNTEHPNGPLSTIMANMFGITTFNTVAASVALIDSSIDTVNEGLRPIYVCQGLFDLVAATGNLSGSTVQIYGDKVSINGQEVNFNCEGKSPGNWGLADFRDCTTGAPGNNLAGWLLNGFNSPLNDDTPEGGYDPVRVGECRSTKPGNNITGDANEDALETLIDNGTEVTLPLYDDWSPGGGSTAQINISGFTGFVFTNYIKDGNQRIIEGRFTRAVCNDNCSSGAPGPAPGGALVKIRLASKS